MTVRLTHRQKPDAQQYIFQALGSPFYLTGIAASLRTGFRMSVPDKIPYIYTGYSASVSKLPPVWATMSSYSLTEGLAVSAQNLPVTVPGGGSPTITVAWHSSSVPSTKPAWVTLTSGTAPTIAFTGGQLDANDVSSMVLSATANGQTVLSTGVSITVSVQSSSLTFTFRPTGPSDTSEGNAVGPATTDQYYQSGLTTIDGTIIDWGTSNHGHGEDNATREYDPAAKTQTEVQTRHTYSGSFGGQTYVGSSYGYPSQYDNRHYWYVPRLNALVIPSRGSFLRASNTWSLVRRIEACPALNVDSEGLGSGSPSQWLQNPPVSVIDGQRVDWAGDQTIDFTSNAIFQPYGSIFLSNVGGYRKDAIYGLSNPHSAWCQELDLGVIIGGAIGGGQYGNTNLIVAAPSANFGPYAQPYVMYIRTMPSPVSGAETVMGYGRDGCCFVGTWVYWGGGFASGNKTRAFFRMNMAPFAYSDTATLNSSTIERLNDIPFDSTLPMLRHDPYSNALIYVGNGGVAMFDLRTMTWSTITPTEYTTFYGGQYPGSCVGGFVDTRSGQMLRRFYWRAGLPLDGNGSLTTFSGTPQEQYDRKTRFVSLKINRPSEIAAGTVSFINTNAAHPENPANSWSIMEGPKHMSIRAVGSGSTRKLLMFSGDWNAPAMSSGYKTGEGPSGSGCQDIWEADISDSALSGGNVRWTLAQNAYHNYPWTGSTGYWGTGRPGGGIEPQRGPFQPDAYGWAVDKRGTYWMGPTANYGNGYIPTSWEMAGYEAAWEAAGNTPPCFMFQWVKPDTNTSGYGVSGVRMGGNGLAQTDPNYKGWKLPNQDTLQHVRDGGSSTDHNITPVLTGASTATYGWGRVSQSGTVYDATNDRLYTMMAGASSSSKTFMFRLYSMDVSPAGYAANGNKYTWTGHSVASIPVKATAPGIPDSAYGSINCGWGDDSRGTLTMSKNMIGRNIYFVLGGSFDSLTGSYANDQYGTRRKFARMFSINVDTNAVEWIPFPSANNWWLRVWDGPNSTSAESPLTPIQNRGLEAVNTKLVMGPDWWHKIGVDPWICVYDTSTKNWTTFSAPSDQDWPMTIGSLVAVPDLNEVWSVGVQGESSAEVTALGLRDPVANAGRRILRFKV